MGKNKMSGNKGEWSELYAFIKLLRDGKIYAADENVERMDNVYFPIIKLIREEQSDEITDYNTGKTIRIFRNGSLIDEINSDELNKPIEVLFSRISQGGGSGAFEIKEAEEIMDKLHLRKIKAPSSDKKDITMQIHDINTSYEPIVGFSIKSDMGSAPTLLNSGKNTRFTYKIEGISDEDMERINAIDKTVSSEYMVSRINEMLKLSKDVLYAGVTDETFEDNLIMIDGDLPELYGNMILYHYVFMEDRIHDCVDLCSILEQINPLGYRRSQNYKYKMKKLLCASALGMTPGREWDGKDNASGGYIIIKKDGDVVCYHLYNRNFFEDYLLDSTYFDRPSASRYDYGYVYKKDNSFFIDLNVQIRFKSVTSSSKSKYLNENLKNKIVRISKFNKGKLKFD